MKVLLTTAGPPSQPVPPAARARGGEDVRLLLLEIRARGGSPPHTGRASPDRLTVFSNLNQRENGKAWTASPCRTIPAFWG